ncbi:inositol 3-kinase [Amaranthus tricolor]|uniref:inositol 3-kinase n=1 Tax=Amaranthus tricolor TaxID=29722 RepID=UPI0025850C33|nr:inositol 3-kinase [Amaranthus tricolor]
MGTKNQTNYKSTRSMAFSHQGLVVGNYCHDILLKDDVVLAESLGGAASFISNIFSLFSIHCSYISKVGLDFNYSHSISTPPIISPTSKTTLFEARFSSTKPNSDGSSGSDRTLKRVFACDPINPIDLPICKRFDFGMAVGVGGEIKLETLEKLVEICDVVFVDVQGLIREFDQIDGTVRLIKLKDTNFYPLLPKIGFLKASAEEAQFLDIEEVRKLCCVVVTDGEKGCKVYWNDGEVEISPFSTVQIDPTGAGDSLLGGFVAGLVLGLSVCDAALLGNFFGSLTVSQIGLPKFDPKLLQRVKDEVQNRSLQCTQHQVGDRNKCRFSKPLGHEQFYETLNAIRRAFYIPVQEYNTDLPDVHHKQTTSTLNHCTKHHCS